MEIKHRVNRDPVNEGLVRSQQCQQRGDFVIGRPDDGCQAVALLEPLKPIRERQSQPTDCSDASP